MDWETVKWHLRSPYASNLYTLDEAVDHRAIEQVAAEIRAHFFYVDGARITTKQQFFDAFSATMQFPDYFGNNWDAFYDMMRDLSWIPAVGVVILYETVQPFAANDTHEFITAMFTLAAVTRDFTESPYAILLR